MIATWNDTDPKDLDGSLLPKLDELDSLPDVLGDYTEPDLEPEWRPDDD